MFYEVEGRARDGVGKLVRAGAKRIVEYFDSPAEGGLEICQVPEVALVRKRLGCNTPVYVYCKLTNRWRVGRDRSHSLARFIIETQQCAEARPAFLQSYTEQRGAAFGIPSLFSSSVDMKTDQIDVVRRVLNDRLRRYSLVDKARSNKERTIADHIHQ